MTDLLFVLRSKACTVVLGKDYAPFLSAVCFAFEVYKRIKIVDAPGFAESIFSVIP